ncbi:MAG TPA: hypothetical protein VE088_01715 [Gaiellaceae bacterium]|nr:hypothetical protein [Gaiellaceae bacterium]
MRRRSPVAAGRAFVVLALAAVLSAPLGGAQATAASARGAFEAVAPPNGVDDTASLQAGLNSCVGKGPNCVVQLGRGRYLTKQLVTYNFQGTLKGAGTGVTTIEALPELPVFQQDVGVQGECLPNTSTCPWPSLIIFVNGQIRVSDLSIRITASDGTETTGWTAFGTRITTLLDAMRFMGQNPTDVTIDRVSIQGLTDESPSSFGVQFGFPVSFNVVNGIIYAGELPLSSTPFDYSFLSGSLTVRNSSFSTMIDGVSQDGFLTSSHITIGGSAAAGNRFDSLFVGIDLESSQSSVFDISHNNVSGLYYGMWVVPWQPAFTPTSLSHYLIHDNTFTATEPGGTGIYLDNEPADWIGAGIWNNTVILQQPGSEGIAVYNTRGTQILGNSISTSGTAADAIGLHLGTTLGTVIRNRLTGFGDAQLGAIFLGPQTSKNIVTCSTTGDTVLDQGTHNLIIGCNGAKGLHP